MEKEREWQIVDSWESSSAEGVTILQDRSLTTGLTGIVRLSYWGNIETVFIKLFYSTVQACRQYERVA